MCNTVEYELYMSISSFLKFANLQNSISADIHVSFQYLINMNSDINFKNIYKIQV